MKVEQELRKQVIKDQVNFFPSTRLFNFKKYKYFNYVLYYVNQSILYTVYEYCVFNIQKMYMYLL